MNDAPAPRIEALGDSALLLHFGERIDLALNARVHALTARLREARLPGLRDLVPAYASVLLRFDPLVWDSDALERALCIDADLPESGEAQATVDRRIVEIPVCYGGDHGPDLAELAQHANMSIEAATAMHGGAEYRVAMLGFAPGFPYLLGLPPALHASRRASPRTRVPAGSVAIGGAQTGIYPRELPGGWQLIGRTPLSLFDLARDPPILLAPGDRVRFRAIDAREFDALANSTAGDTEPLPQPLSRRERG